MTTLDLVQPSAFYSAGGHRADNQRPQMPYIALVPLSRYDDPDPDPLAGLRTASRGPRPDFAKVSAALDARQKRFLDSPLFRA